MDKQTVKIQKRLAKKVLALRTRRGWTQEECADHMDLATAYLSRVERCLVNVTLRNLVKIASAFDMDVYELLKP